MTRRQIVTTLIFIAAGSVGGIAEAHGQESGAIRGVVTRLGTEPLDGAQVTLQGGAANPQALQTLLNTAASQGIVVKPEPGASTSQIVQALSSAAVARGFPLTTANLYTQLASLSGKTPPTTTTDRDGRFRCQPRRLHRPRPERRLFREVRGRVQPCHCRNRRRRCVPSPIRTLRSSRRTRIGAG